MRLHRKVLADPERWQLEAPELRSTPTDLAFTFTDAVTEYLAGLMGEGIPLPKHIQQLAAAARLPQG